jgi:hypothetical protein
MKRATRAVLPVKGLKYSSIRGEAERVKADVGVTRAQLRAAVMEIQHGVEEIHLDIGKFAEMIIGIERTLREDLVRTVVRVKTLERIVIEKLGIDAVTMAAMTQSVFESTVESLKKREGA